MEKIRILDHPASTGSKNKTTVSLVKDDGRELTFEVEGYEIKRVPGNLRACFVTLHILTFDTVLTYQQ